MLFDNFICTKPAMLAPMSGITDVPFRSLVHRFGAGFVVSEMEACNRLLKDHQERSKKIQSAGIYPHIVQLAGCDPYWMSIGAKIAVEEAGADIIDINMGCPSRQVTGGFSGSALMKDLDHAEKLIEAVVSSVALPVTLKMRLGWDHRNLNALDLAKRAENAGIKMIAIHGRTRQQFYKGSADWQAIFTICQAVKIPTVVNGDISSLESAEKALNVSGADAVMIGRAAIGRPWLIGDIAWKLSGKKEKNYQKGLLQDIILEHYESILSYYGSQKGVCIARKHLAGYLSSLQVTDMEKKKIRSELCQADNPEFVKKRIKNYFAGIKLI